MNTKDIKKLNHLMKFEYANDVNGKIITNGDICVPCGFEHFIQYLNDKIIFDFSRLQIVHSTFKLKYEYLCQGDFNKIVVDTDSTFQFFIVEYFKIDDSFIYPFMHSYNGINYRLWYEKETSKNLLKLEDADLSKVVIRFPKTIDLDLLSIHLQKSVECNGNLDYIEIPLTYFKCWKFIQKMLRGIKQREAWTLKYDKLPQIYLNVNDSTENKFTLSNLSNKNIYLKEFYSESEENRKLYIYCQHPKRNHKEYFYIYENDNVKEI